MPALVITVNKEKRGAILQATHGKVVVIGRDEACDVPLPEAVGVSRQHCSITCKDNTFILQDLGSTNGTYANAVKIEGAIPLKEGVTYTIGDAEFQVMGLSLVANTTPEDKKENAPVPKNNDEANTPAEKKKNESRPRAKKSRRQKKKKRKAPRFLASMIKILNPVTRDINAARVSIVEIILVLIVTFYGGIALYSYLNGGSFLPPFLD